MIEVKNISYTYMKKTPFEKTALENISFTVNEGDFFAIAGLIDLQSGTVEVDGGKNFRGKIGMVFQYPEHQLFEETVEKDISFGPRNFGLSEEEISARVDEAIRQVDLDESLKNVSAFELSGGQKRRVAIAGILAENISYSGASFLYRACW